MCSPMPRLTSFMAQLPKEAQQDLLRRQINEHNARVAAENLRTIRGARVGMLLLVALVVVAVVCVAQLVGVGS